MIKEELIEALPKVSENFAKGVSPYGAVKKSTSDNEQEYIHLYTEIDLILAFRFGGQYVLEQLGIEL